jgi:hypothetical protein
MQNIQGGVVMALTSAPRLFPPGGCEACKFRPPFDVSVDITDALRRSNLRRADAVLKV